MDLFHNWRANSVILHLSQVSFLVSTTFLKTVVFSVKKRGLEGELAYRGKKNNHTRQFSI